MQVIFSDEVWERAPQQVEQVLALARIDPSARILDMPCGVGRHTLEFARLGCNVTAVDRTTFYLNQASERASDLGLDIEFVEADMRDFQRPAAFDLALNLFTSFGYFEAIADDLKVLANFFVSLRPGGALVMDMAGKEVLARIFAPRDWRELDNDTLVLEERSVNQAWTWLENRRIMIKDGERRDLSFSHRLYGASDLKRALEQTGFTSIRVYGSLSGAPYDHTAERLVVVARKPTTG
jgi:SAM-dependent methyltransferase